MDPIPESKADAHRRKSRERVARWRARNPQLARDRNYEAVLKHRAAGKRKVIIRRVVKPVAPVKVVTPKVKTPRAVKSPKPVEVKKPIVAVPPFSTHAALPDAMSQRERFLAWRKERAK